MFLSKLCYRPCPGHPLYMPVKLFYKNGDSYKKQHLTLPLSTTDSKHVLITTTNPMIEAYLRQEHNCRTEEQPFTVAKHLGEVMQLDVVNLITLSCDRFTCEMEWDVFYYVPPGIPIQLGRSYLHFRQTLDEDAEGSSIEY